MLADITGQPNTTSTTGSFTQQNRNGMLLPESQMYENYCRNLKQAYLLRMVLIYLPEAMKQKGVTA